MNNLPIINREDGAKAVDARSLHNALESNQQFSDWMKNRISQYGFEEGVDYELNKESFHKIMKGRKFAVKDYTISLDMAKELAMVERNEKGRQVRKYFIAVEKEARKIYSEQKEVRSEHTLLHKGTITVKMLENIMHLEKAFDRKEMLAAAIDMASIKRGMESERINIINP